MNIDRSRFLFLATAIASGCGPRQPATEVPVSSTTVGATSGTPGGVPVPDGATATGSAWSSTEASPPTKQNDEGVGVWPSAEGYPSAEGFPSSEGYYPSTNTKKKPSPKPQCGVDETSGTPGNCQALKLDKSCAPFPFINSACADSAKFMKPKIAERAVACIRTKSPKQLCDAMSVYDCKDEALHTACPDASADADCAAIVSSCKKTSMTECRTYLSGLNALGRSEMVMCMKNDCSWGLYSCSEGL